MEKNKVVENDELEEKTSKEIELKRIFSKRLEEARKKTKNLTQGKLAEKIDSNNSHISNLENGKQLPSLLTAVQLAKKTKTSLDWLCGLSDSSLNETKNDVQSDDVFHKEPLTIAFLQIINKYNPIIVTDSGKKDKNIIRMEFKIETGFAEKEFDLLIQFLNECKAVQVLINSDDPPTELIDAVIKSMIERYEEKLQKPYLIESKEKIEKM